MSFPINLTIVSGLAVLVLLVAVAALATRLWVERRGRRRAEARARQFLATMAHLDRRARVGQLTASLAHELNQPLGAILRNSEAAGMLLRSGEPPLAELREIVDDIRKDDKRAAEIIRRLRMLLQKRELGAEAVDLNDVTRETVAFVAPEAASRGVRLELAVAALPSVVRGDRVHLQQALLNLVTNALDAMALTPSEHRRLVVATTLHRRHVEVSVEDSGSGFPDASVEQLFEPFYTTKKDGLGVGLSIARSIVEAHKGRILAENNRGRGATVRFSLPLQRRGREGRHAQYDHARRIH
jgi:signal transduction histidine kinase